MESAVRTAHAVTVKFDLLRPWRPLRRLVGQAGFALTSMPIGIVTFTTVVTLASVTVGLLITFVLALPVAWLLFVVSRGLRPARTIAGGGARSDVGIGRPRPPARPRRDGCRRLHERGPLEARWREIGHHLAAAAGRRARLRADRRRVVRIGGAAAPCRRYVDALPGDSAKFYFFEVHQGVGRVVAALVGVVGLVSSPRGSTVASSRSMLAMATALLGPTAERAQRGPGHPARDEPDGGGRQRRGRAAADRARPPRRCPAAAGGAGRRTWVRRSEKLEAPTPRQGRAMVADAHEEAKAALKEIRDLVRGIHPVILEDRGLDAALSAVVARAPVPVHARRARRPTAAGGGRERGVLRRQRGADQRRPARQGDPRRGVDRPRRRPAGARGPRRRRRWRRCRRGTGLQGLRDRVAALGGTMHVISPHGGPTTISVELPCGS